MSEIIFFWYRSEIIFFWYRSEIIFFWYMSEIIFFWYRSEIIFFWYRSEIIFLLIYVGDNFLRLRMWRIVTKNILCVTIYNSVNNIRKYLLWHWHRCRVWCSSNPDNFGTQNTWRLTMHPGYTKDIWTD